MFDVRKEMALFAVVSALVAMAQAPAPAPAAPAQLSQVRNVYLLSMGSALDQYLANRLTNEGVFHVVTDPLQADALLTDRIGKPFEERFTELYAPPPPPKTDQDKEKEKDEHKTAEVARIGGGFSRGKGNVFLVDRKTKTVIWSVFQQPKSTSSEDVDKIAVRIVAKLKKDLGLVPGK